MQLLRLAACRSSLCELALAVSQHRQTTMDLDPVDPLGPLPVPPFRHGTGDDCGAAISVQPVRIMTE